MSDLDETPTQVKLTELTNEANLKYSLKNYNEAAELYSRATEMQSALRGDDMAPENAELLFLYGRCLYKVAVLKSDVLGGQVAGDKKKVEEALKVATGGAKAPASPGQKLAEDVVEAVVEEKEGSAEQKNDPKAPFFQLVDAEWSDEEEEDDPEVQEALEEEDDFANAYEILDLARVLLQLQIGEAKEPAENGEGTSKGKDKVETVELSSEQRHVKERLAETYDLQAEISLENEKFGEAAQDFQSAAALKDELYPKASSIVAEAHYKLSLALEFDAMSAIREAQSKEGEPIQTSKAEQPQVDEKLREQAAKETELAIESIKLRIPEEEKALAELSGEAAKKKKDEIADVKDILKEMEDRLKELHGPAVSINVPSGAPGNDEMAGILAQVLGESKAQQQARIEEASKNANDLTGLIKKKKPKPQQPAAANGTSAVGSSTTNGKRKLDDDLGGTVDDAKRAKTEEPAEAR